MKQANQTSHPHTYTHTHTHTHTPTVLCCQLNCYESSQVFLYCVYATLGKSSQNEPKPGVSKDICKWII